MQGQKITREEQVRRAIACFCEYCRGKGFILGYYCLPTKMNSVRGSNKFRSYSYRDCGVCGGTGLKKKWWRFKGRDVPTTSNNKSS